MKKKIEVSVNSELHLKEGKYKLFVLGVRRVKFNGAEIKIFQKNMNIELDEPVLRPTSLYKGIIMLHTHTFEIPNSGVYQVLTENYENIVAERTDSPILDFYNKLFFGKSRYVKLDSLCYVIKKVR